MNFIGKNTLSKVKDILRAKGYQVATASDLEERAAEYSLEIVGVSGIGCGTGLRRHDYLTIPGSFSVSLAVVNGNEIFKREGDFIAVTLTDGRVGRRKVLNAVKKLPRCEQ